ncbi:MAG: hypothetical protein V8S74_11225 [Lachnospirales bacterium]
MYTNVSGNQLVYGGSIPWFFPIIRTIGIIILIALYLLFVFYIISRMKFESSFKGLIIIMCPFITINYIGNIILMILICLIFGSEYGKYTNEKDKSEYILSADGVPIPGRTIVMVESQQLITIAFVFALWVALLLAVNLPKSNYEDASDNNKAMIEALTVYNYHDNYDDNHHNNYITTTTNGSKQQRVQHKLLLYPNRICM